MPNDRLKRTREFYKDKTDPAAPLDLEERLRSQASGEDYGRYPNLPASLREAAAEVERLRAELERRDNTEYEVDQCPRCGHRAAFVTLRAAQTWQPIRELPGHWRAQARSIADTANNYDIANAMVSCADELEAALPPTPEEPST